MSITDVVETLNSFDCRAVVERAIREIRGAPALPHVAALPDATLTEWCTSAEAGLQMWIHGQDSTIVNMIYYDLGRAGATAGIPPPELVQALALVLNVGRIAASTVDSGPYNPLTMFSQYAQYYLARGYEDALR